MPLFRRQQSSPDSGPRPIPGPKDSAALSEILAELEEELWRARRYERPLSVATAAPVLLKGERLGEKLASSVLETAKHALRRSDGVRIVDGPLLIAILPETDAQEGHAAAYRLGSALTLPGIASRQVKWRASSTTLTTETTAAELLESALSRLSNAA